VQERGGSHNAFTAEDNTVYFENAAAPHLDLLLELEADRMANLTLDDSGFAAEKKIVMEERRMRTVDDPASELMEQLSAAAYTAHPYGWPVVGWMVDIENWKPEDLKRHFEMGYSPSNATMVVSGDVTPEEIIKLAEKYIEPIQSHAPPPPVTTREPEQLGERRVTVKKFAQLPLMMIGYHTVDAKSPDYYPLQVLQTILFSGQSSRMYQRLVDKDQIALFVGGGLGPAFDPALFTITAQPKANAQPEAVEKAIYEEFDKVKTKEVTDQELEKAKNILLANFYRSLKTISGKANTLGSYEVFFGDYRKLFTAAEDYAKVTKADLQRVAQKYFTDKNRTVATLTPEKPEEGKKAVGSGQ